MNEQITPEARRVQLEDELFQGTRELAEIDLTAAMGVIEQLSFLLKVQFNEIVAKSIKSKKNRKAK